MPQVPTLYHGTDARFVRMTEQERLFYKDACYLAISYLWPFYEPYNLGGGQELELYSLLDYEHNPRQWGMVCDALRGIRRMKSGHSQFQYQTDSIYLTCDEDVAKSFARLAYAGGELGRFTHILLKSVPLMPFLDWNPQGQIFDAINRIIGFSSETPEPIVFSFDNLDWTCMLTDTDQPIEFNENELISHMQFRVVRYLKPLVLNLQDAIRV